MRRRPGPWAPRPRAWRLRGRRRRGLVDLPRAPLPSRAAARLRGPRARALHALAAVVAGGGASSSRCTRTTSSLTSARDADTRPPENRLARGLGTTMPSSRPVRLARVEAVEGGARAGLCVLRGGPLPPELSRACRSASVRRAIRASLSGFTSDPRVASPYRGAALSRSSPGPRTAGLKPPSEATTLVLERAADKAGYLLAAVLLNRLDTLEGATRGQHESREIVSTEGARLRPPEAFPSASSCAVPMARTRRRGEGSA